MDFTDKESAIYICASLRDCAPGEQPLKIGFFNNPTASDKKQQRKILPAGSIILIELVI